MFPTRDRTEAKALASLKHVLDKAFARGGIDTVLEVCSGLLKDAENVCGIGSLGGSDANALRLDLASFLDQVWAPTLMQRLQDPERVGGLGDVLTGEEKLAQIGAVVDGLGLKNTT